MTSNPNKLRCNICCLDISRRKYFTHLKNVHNVERPYKCTECKKAFTAAANLKQHLVVHTDERKYQCKKCDKTYKLACGLRHHVRKTHK